MQEHAWTCCDRDNAWRHMPPHHSRTDVTCAYMHMPARATAPVCNHLTAVVCTRAGSLAPIDSVPFESRAINSVLQFVTLTLKNWEVAWMRGDTQGMPRGWLYLIWLVLLRSARTVDACSDMGLSAVLYYSWKSKSCFWDGALRCLLYGQLTIVVGVASGLDFLLSVALALVPSAQRGRLHIGIHTVSLLCEAALLTVTVLLGQHKASDALSSNSTMIFLIMSGVLNAVTFVLNVLGMRAVMQMALQSVAGSLHTHRPAEEPVTLATASTQLGYGTGQTIRLLSLRSVVRRSSSVLPSATSICDH